MSNDVGTIEYHYFQTQVARNEFILKLPDYRNGYIRHISAEKYATFRSATLQPQTKKNDFYLCEQNAASKQAHLVTLSFKKENNKWEITSRYVPTKDLKAHLDLFKGYVPITDSALSSEEIKYVQDKTEKGSRAPA